MTTASWWIVVLNWNGREDTLACLASLRELEGEPVHVVVADNGSSDGSVAAIHQAHPEVTLIENGANLGFSGGNNAGIRHALEHGADWVVLLNNDATLNPDAIDALRRAAAERPDAGAFAGKLFFADPPDLIWFAGQRFSPLLGYSGRPRGYRKPDAPQFRERIPVDRAAGALMAVSRPALERAGLLDEDLFAYVEDVDWSLRIREAGFALLLEPTAIAVHRVSGSTGGERGSTYAMYYGLRNMIAVCDRHRPLPRPLAALRRWELWAVFMAQALLLSERRGPFVRAVRDGYRDARAGRYGERPSSSSA